MARVLTEDAWWTDDLIEHLIKVEGYKSGSYNSHEGGNNTVGIGHKLTDTELQTGIIILNGQKIMWRNGLSKPEAIALAKQYSITLFKEIGVKPEELNAKQVNAIVNVGFTLGSTKLKPTNFLKAVLAEEWREAWRNVTDIHTTNGETGVKTGLGQRFPELAELNNQEDHLLYARHNPIDPKNNYMSIPVERYTEEKHGVHTQTPKTFAQYTVEKNQAYADSNDKNNFNYLSFADWKNDLPPSGLPLAPETSGEPEGDRVKMNIPNLVKERQGNKTKVAGEVQLAALMEQEGEDFDLFGWIYKTVKEKLIDPASDLGKRAWGVLEDGAEDGLDVLEELFNQDSAPYQYGLRGGPKGKGAIKNSPRVMTLDNMSPQEMSKIQMRMQAEAPNKQEDAEFLSARAALEARMNGQSSTEEAVESPEAIPVEAVESPEAIPTEAIESPEVTNEQPIKESKMENEDSNYLVDVGSDVIDWIKENPAEAAMWAVSLHPAGRLAKAGYHGMKFLATKFGTKAIQGAKKVASNPNVRRKLGDTQKTWGKGGANRTVNEKVYSTRARAETAIRTQQSRGKLEVMKTKDGYITVPTKGNVAGNVASKAAIPVAAGVSIFGGSDKETDADSTAELSFDDALAEALKKTKERYHPENNPNATFEYKGKTYAAWSYKDQDSYSKIGDLGGQEQEDDNWMQDLLQKVGVNYFDNEYIYGKRAGDKGDFTLDNMTPEEMHKVSLHMQAVAKNKQDDSKFKIAQAELYEAMADEIE